MSEELEAVELEPLMSRTSLASSITVELVKQRVAAIMMATRTTGAHVLQSLQAILTNVWGPDRMVSYTIKLPYCNADGSNCHEFLFLDIS